MLFILFSITVAFWFKYFCASRNVCYVFFLSLHKTLKVVIVSPFFCSISLGAANLWKNWYVKALTKLVYSMRYQRIFVYLTNMKILQIWNKLYYSEWLKYQVSVKKGYQRIFVSIINYRNKIHLCIMDATGNQGVIKVIFGVGRTISSVFSIFNTIFEFWEAHLYLVYAKKDWLPKKCMIVPFRPANTSEIFSVEHFNKFLILINLGQHLRFCA